MKSVNYASFSFQLVCGKLVFLSYDFDNSPTPMGYNFLLLVKDRKKLFWLRLNCCWFIDDAKVLDKSFIKDHAAFNIEVLCEILKGRYTWKDLQLYVESNVSTLFYYPDFENLNKKKFDKVVEVSKDSFPDRVIRDLSNPNDFVN